MTAPASASVAVSLPDPALADLVEELAKSLQAGEPVDLDALAVRHPDRAEQVRQLLPAIRILAELGSLGRPGRQPTGASEPRS
jgi:hypothetical protein